MCGFIACMYQHPLYKKDPSIYKEMSNAIQHRGPDQEGVYEDEYVNLFFRRLSIVDLEHGSQPMSYENERYWIVFNGEIYNFSELRATLIDKGHIFKTTSDTEVILALYSEVKEKAVQQLRGMFSFVIYDKVEKELFGARDPFGIKPLYYLQSDEFIVFSSEKKSLLYHQEQGEEQINTQSVQHYLSFQYVPEPFTMITNIHKVPAGHYFKKTLDDNLKMNCYYQVTFKPRRDNEDVVIKQVREEVIHSVKAHIMGDVQVGSFLSGGIDSTIIASIAKDYVPNFQTFSVGFEQHEYSELSIAKETAYQLGVPNHSKVISADEFLKELPKIVWHLDDPLADPACIPLYFVSKEARKHVTVALSGEGADELFGGYNIYKEPQSLELFSFIPNHVKMNLLKLARILPEGMKGKNFIERGCISIEERYIGNAKIFLEDEKKRILVEGMHDQTYRCITSPFYKKSLHLDPVTRMQDIDMQTWLKGDILLKADKMSMANSLELRVPFLDKHVFEVASRLPSEYKIREGTTKWVLRKAFEGTVPQHVLNRRKLGFPVPIRVWLRNEWYDWARSLVFESETEHIFNKSYVLDLLDEHASQKKDHSRKIWTVLQFMMWHQVFIEGTYNFNENHETKKKREFSFQ
ncbi:asparagine synthase (glutamine-hydrolyzing) [Bacillus suaedaesalsae]|uniref:asparagine synthase (glutamine-hydrolyzing) n=1 Tax=Bacillus suaedaesalsae TaxID=2810349 RepID=A0ABS2DKF6_9BACI|nr:asparagine synthase (glutamine-hydrolyzing) [Bacillus suaedaesalsae]MBM6618918.1 asparagine synthase (glutamine-hydrolyzing) [Bacillus suaedaesalsae]